DKYRIEASRMKLYQVISRTDEQIARARVNSAREALAAADSGYERPIALGPIESDVLQNACPALRVRGLDTDTIQDAGHFDEVWGPYEQLVKAHATDPEVRHRASTGGVLTALGQYLLDSEEVDFILHVKAGGRDPSFGEVTISETKGEVLEAAGSRYGPAAPLETIDEVLDRGQPFAFIAKPCDLSALRALGEHDPRVGQLVKAYLSPVCGGTMPPKQLGMFYERMGVAREDVTALRYRGYGCPGDTVAKTPEQTVSATYEEFWGEDSSQWQIPWRCKICGDGIGDAADVAAADDWPNAAPDMEAAKTDPGTNVNIVRTKRGKSLVEAAEKAGFLTLGEEVTPAYMTSVQPHQMRKKMSALARWEALEEMGRLKPSSTNLRLEELGQKLTEDQRNEQIEGVKARVKLGKAQD
ncbi:MAG: Coenzyme F420 hydrogenase/dehydrogenase, beta subunit C-terminal domain, partial [Pseudomonadota bacterium]